MSLTADPVEEVGIARQILKALGHNKTGIEIISCPMCGRIEYDLARVVNEIEEKTRDIKADLKVAIMGCSVNGPGEAKEADIGLAGGRGQGLIFAGGKIVKKVTENEMVDELLKEIKRRL